MRKYMALLAVLALVATYPGTLIAAQRSDTSATIIKIEGKKITLRNDKGEISTVISEPAAFKVGQRVGLHNGRIVKGGSNPPAVTPRKPAGLNPGNPVGINPQPEPPGKNF